MLILGVLAVICARFAFVRNTKNDSIVLLSPFSFVLLVVQSIAWGFGTGEMIIFYISLAVAAVNYRSFLRFFSSLYVDTYSVAFSIFSVLLFIIIILTGIFFVQNRPVVMDETKLSVTKTTELYSGNLNSEFVLSTQPLERRNLTLTIYTPDESKGNKQDNNIILFIPDKRAHVYNYEPYLLLLCKAGYKIYAGEFGFSTVPAKYNVSVDFIRQRIMFLNSRYSEEKYFAKHSNYYDIYAREYEILSRIAAKKEGDDKKFIIVGDGIPEKSFMKILNPARQLSCIGLSMVKEYRTNGYGFVEQTNPVLANLRFGLKRDKRNYAPSHAVLETKKMINRFKDQEEEGNE